MTGEMLFAYSNSPWVSTLEDFSTGRCGDIDAWLNIQCDGKKQGAFVNFSRPVYPDSLFGDAEFTSVELFSTRVRFDDDLPFFALMGYDPSEPTYVIFFDQGIVDDIAKSKSMTLEMNYAGCSSAHYRFNLRGAKSNIRKMMSYCD